MDKTAVKRANCLIIALLVLITLGVYWQVWDFEFTNYDDDVYVENNPVVMAGLSAPTVKWALSASYQATWQPVVWISLMVDAEVAKWADWLGGIELGRKNAGVFHITNVLLHLANTLLLFVLLLRLTDRRWPSAFVAALFAIHPLHVESVAWVTERKDVLSTFFWLLAMLAYVDYIRGPSPKRYAMVVGAFVLGLMSKPMLVSLPFVLVLTDYWPLKRFSSLKSLPTALREKAPLLAVAVIGCVLAVWAQKAGGAVASLDLYPLGVRLANSVVAYVVYLKMMLVPVGLAVLYPHPGRGIPAWQMIGSALLMLALTGLALRAARSRLYVTVGWLWYVITLVPVIGIVQFGKHALADRFTYVPLIGVFIIVAWGVPDMLRAILKTDANDCRVAYPLAALGTLAVVALMIPAYTQVGYWRDSAALFSHAVRVTRGNSLAYNNLGNALLARGEAEAAIPQFRLALKYHPEYTDADYNLGNALFQAGDVGGAIRQYLKVIRAEPKYVSARNNLGSIFAQQGKYDQAIEQFNAVLRIDPHNQTARGNLESALQAKSGGL